MDQAALPEGLTIALPPSLPAKAQEVVALVAFKSVFKLLYIARLYFSYLV
jgi:hypothetical protein